MAERLIRMGKVSSIDYENGMISVTYPDLDNSTTDNFPVFSLTDEYKMPGIGQEVLILHMSNGQSAGIVLGRYWNKGNRPPISGENVFRKELGKTIGEAYIQYADGSITLHDPTGASTLGNILSRLSALEREDESIKERLQAVEEKV
ncbi:hypothetical protein [Blautia sp. An81]|uniref:hypothetical protein n=1 Tax=Blautia sp. An81 TaxID=1965659 RepID=UPI000B3887B2|nr:hypothetical protein [Blautia sp. An81]OUN27799.1 hypothetical protein B5G33_13280 [Blautia sp. An81]